jgi:hypothetical protein
MERGFVLNFSDNTMKEFFLESIRINIYEEKYNQSSGSKANRMRAFWEKEPNHIVGKLLLDIFENWKELNELNKEEPPNELAEIARRLLENISVPEIDAIKPITDEKDFEGIAKLVRESIEKNEPENGLDRLHTYLVKYFRVRCEKYGIAIDKNKPLHSLVGEYIKEIKSKGLIETEMTERILKSSISVMESFNDVRNNKTYAHDNPILNYNESILIFGHVTNAIRFIERIEATEQLQERPQETFENSYNNTLPF